MPLPLAWCLWGAGTPGPRMGHPLSRGAGPWGWGEDSWWSRAGEAAGHGTVCRGLEAAASSRAGPCRSRGGRGGWRVQHGSLQPRPCPLSTARGAQAAQHQHHRAARPALPAARPFSPGAPAPSVPAAPSPQPQSKPSTSPAPLAAPAGYSLPEATLQSCCAAPLAEGTSQPGMSVWTGADSWAGFF